MEESLFDKSKRVTSESVHYLSTVKIKRNWQSPIMLELDYNETNNGAGPGSDASDGS